MLWPTFYRLHSILIKERLPTCRTVHLKNNNYINILYLLSTTDVPVLIIIGRNRLELPEPSLTFKIERPTVPVTADIGPITCVFLNNVRALPACRIPA